MSGNKNYVGLTADLEAGVGITATAKIVLDAQLFGFIDETETCENWPVTKIQELYDRGARAWEPYGGLPSRLPEDLAKRHAALYQAATKHTKDAGWDPMKDLQNEA